MHVKPLLHIGGFRRRLTAVPKPWWSANERHKAPTEPRVNATKRQWWRWPYGSFELFKTSAVERRSQVCPSWSAAKRRQLCAIVGERTGTATRRRAAQPLGTAVELQQAAFADAPLRPTAVLRRLCAVLRRFGHDFLRSMAHNHASWRVHYALAHFPTLYGARWRRSAIDGVRWRSTAFNGGLIQFSYKKKRIKHVCSQFILVLDSSAMAFMLPGDRLRVLQAWLQLNRVNRDRDIDVVQYLMFAEARRPRRRRRFWVRPWLERRPLHGQYERLMVEMTQEDPASFRNFLRMEPAMFRELLVRIGPRLQRKTTFWRQPLDAGLKLAITLRHLATGDSYMSLMYSFRVHSSTISLFVPEVCDAITELLEDEVITKPTTLDQWLEVAELFGTRWQVHHALNGKHVRIRQPRRGGSLYFNYKHFHSIILLALADADYRFIWVDVGANGSASDCQVFNESDLKDCIDSRIIGFHLLGTRSSWGPQTWLQGRAPRQ